MTTILLIRHGQNEWVKEHRLAGWIPNVNLNETGKEQAADAAKRIEHLPISAVYSSPLERCVETATIIADHINLPIKTTEGVGEVRYGTWEGEKIQTLTEEHKEAWFAVQFFPSRFGFPEGESLRTVQARAIDTLEALVAKHPKETIVVVSHADLIKLVLAYYLGTHIDLFQRIGLSPASVSAIHLMSNGGVRVLRVNDNGKLDVPKPPTKEDKESSNPSESADNPSSSHDGKE